MSGKTATRDRFARSNRPFYKVTDDDEGSG